MGFDQDEIGQLGDRLVDALVAWGDPDTVAARIFEHLRAGAACRCGRDHRLASHPSGRPVA
jgi:hypothetical protein